jgi:hypothetical protein
VTSTPPTLTGARERPSTCRLSFAAALAICAGGCGLIAGYDFGKFNEEGAGGAAGAAASSASTSSASSSASSPVSSSASSGASSASGGGTDGGGITTLVDNLASPDAIGLDASNVYYTTLLPLSVSTAGWVAKDKSASGTPLTNVEQAWGLAMDGSTAYVATTTYAAMVSGDVYSYGPSAASAQVSSMLGQPVGGVAVNGGVVYFTSSPSAPDAGLGSSGVWSKISGQAETLIVPGPADGPIAADSGGLYWPGDGQMYRSNLDGTGVAMLATLGTFVNGIATDAMYLYWTEGTAVRRVDKQLGGTTFDVSMVTGSAYGLTIDAPNGLVFFTHDDAVSQVDLSSMVTTTLQSGLMNPHGVGVDSAFVYVALNGTFMMTDGSIVKFAR